MMAKRAWLERVGFFSRRGFFPHSSHSFFFLISSDDNFFINYSNVYIIIVNAMNAHTQSLFYAFLCLSGRFMLISQRPKMGHFMLISLRTPFYDCQTKSTAFNAYQTGY